MTPPTSSSSNKRRNGSGWRDDPIASPDQDRLNRGQFADHAARLIDGNHSPDSSVVYGLEGPWGSGKSSALSLVAGYLGTSGGRRWQIVRFTPWATTGTEALLEEFFNALSTAVPEAGKNNQLRERLRSYAEIARPIAAAVPVLGSALAEASRSVEARMRKPWNVAFDEIAAELRQLDTAILIVVDDIDRLQPTELLDLLKVVRLLGRFPGVDFLLAYDEQTVVETLQDPRRGTVTRERARAFMEKIVQYPLSMPPLLTNKIINMVAEGLTEILTPERVEDSFDRRRFSRVLTDTMPGQLTTPRAIGRFLAQVEQQVSMHDLAEMDDTDLILATFLRVQFPDLFSTLQAWKADLTHGASRWTLTSRREDTGPDWDAKLSEVVEGERNRDDSRAVLEALFPAVSNRDSQRTEPLRFAHPDYFDRYLAQSIPDGDIPDASISSALESAASGNAVFLRSLLLNDSDDLVALAINKIRSRYPDISEPWRHAETRGPLTLDLLASGMGVVGELRDRRAAWTSELAQTTYWMANVIRTIVDREPDVQLAEALAACMRLDRRAHVASYAANEIGDLNERTQEGLRRTLREVANDLLPLLVTDLHAGDQSEGLAGGSWLYSIVSEAGLFADLQAAVADGLRVGDFAVEDVAARFVSFAYVIGGSGELPSSASFSGSEFTRLTGVPAESTDHSERFDWPDTSWPRRRAFAATFIEGSAIA